MTNRTISSVLIIGGALLLIVSLIADLIGLGSTLGLIGHS